MKKTILNLPESNLGKTLSKEEMRSVLGGLEDSCTVTTICYNMQGQNTGSVSCTSTDNKCSKNDWSVTCDNTTTNC